MHGHICAEHGAQVIVLVPIIVKDHNAHPISMQFIPVICSLLRDFKETNLVTPALVKACRKTNKLQNPQRLKGLLVNWIFSSPLPSDDFHGNSIYSKRSYLNDKHGPILLKYLAKITVDSTGRALYQTMEPNQLAVPGKIKWKQQNQWDVSNRRNQQGPVGLPRNLPHGMLLLNSS